MAPIMDLRIIGVNPMKVNSISVFVNDDSDTTWNIHRTADGYKWRVFSHNIPVASGFNRYYFQASWEATRYAEIWK